MDRPDRLNAQGAAMRHELREALDEFAADPEMRVGIFTGAGRAFSAGADLKEMSTQSGSLAAQQGLGFEGSIGYQSLNGEYGDVLKGGVDGEFSIVWTRSKLRYGIGLDWASYQMVEPFEKESWSNVAGHLALSFFPFAEGGGRVRPWIEIRTVARRLRPEGDFLGGGHAPPDEEGENISPIRVFGMSGAAVAGVEIGLTRRSWLKLGGYLSTINTENAELGEIDLGTVDSGSIIGFRLGLLWIP